MVKSKTYEIQFAENLKKQLKKVPKKFLLQIFERIEKLKENPRGQGSEPLQGVGPNIHRVRQGDYRIIYTVQDEKLIILVIRIGNRKEIYKSPFLNL